MFAPAAARSAMSPAPLPPMPMQPRLTRSLAPHTRAGRTVKANAETAVPRTKVLRFMRRWDIGRILRVKGWRVTERERRLANDRGFFTGDGPRCRIACQDAINGWH